MLGYGRAFCGPFPKCSLAWGCYLRIGFPHLQQAGRQIFPQPAVRRRCYVAASDGDQMTVFAVQRCLYRLEVLTFLLASPDWLQMLTDC